MTHWIDGGETTLANTVLLCRRHHRTLHDYGFEVERTGDRLVFRDPRGREIPEAPARGSAEGFAGLRARVSGISAESNQPGWDGQPVNYDLCVASLTGAA